MARGDVLGFDLYIGPVAGGLVDVAPDGRAASGLELTRNEMVSRCLSDTLSMVGAPGGVVAWGKDLRQLVGGAVGPSFAATLAQQMVVIFNRSPRLDPGATTCTVQTTGAPPRYTFTLFATARTTTQLPISVLLGINAYSVDVLAAQGAST